MYISRKEGGRELINIEDRVDVSIKGLKDYIKKSKKKKKKKKTNHCSQYQNWQHRKTTETWKQKWEEKKCMDILSDKLAKFHSRRHGPGSEKEISRESLNLFK